MTDINEERPIFDRILEDKIKFGKYQYQLYFIIALTMITDGAALSIFPIWRILKQKEWREALTNPELTFAVSYATLFLGAILGSLASGRAITDRKDAILLTNLTKFVLSGLSLLAQSYLLILLRGVLAIGVGITFPMGPAMVAELTPTTFRGRGTTITYGFFLIGQMYSTMVLVHTSENWRMILLALSSLLSLLATISAWMFLKESPRLLIANGEIDEAISTLNEIGEINNRDEYHRITKAEKREVKKWKQKHYESLNSTSCNSLFLPEYSRSTICLSTMGFCTKFIDQGVYLTIAMNLFSYVENRNSLEMLEKEMFFAFGGEALGVLLTLILIERVRFGRKNSIIVLMSMASIIMITKPTIWLEYLPTLIVKLCLSVSYGMQASLAADMYPTVIRLSGISLWNISALFGALCMPVALGISFAIFQPGSLLIFVLAAVAVVVMCKLVPYDTRGIDLDDDSQKDHYLELPEESRDLGIRIPSTDV